MCVLSFVVFHVDLHPHQSDCVTNLEQLELLQAIHSILVYHIKVNHDLYDIPLDVVEHIIYGSCHVSCLVFVSIDDTNGVY